jgi:cytosine/uracil/thiamine/allantoin permease
MWKILIVFFAFAALAVWVLSKAGGDVDMGGEKHSVETPAAAEASKATGAGGPAVSTPAAAEAAASR